MGPGPAAVGTGSYDLVLADDLDLGGAIFKGGNPFLHDDGYGTAVGSRALVSLTSGADNSAFGTSALSATTTGSSNVAVGNSALPVNQDGSYNVAVGAEALKENVHGPLNTAVGFRSLAKSVGFYLTSAWYSGNTALGAYALENTTSAVYNTAVGRSALRANTTGTSNTAVGTAALASSTTARQNTAVGNGALSYLLTGERNTAVGTNAGRLNMYGPGNTAIGFDALDWGGEAYKAPSWHGANTAVGAYALKHNSSGTDNTAVGYQAGRYASGSGNVAVGAGAFINYFGTGSDNIVVGKDAGSVLRAGSSNILIGHAGGSAGESYTIRIGTSGTHTRAFVAGIDGVTVGSGAGAVLVDGSDQLGTVASARRYKQDIAEMGDATARLLDLRPVTFRYRKHAAAGDRRLQYGLIAEEVAEVFPDLVVLDDEGRPRTVLYHELSSMLLNELQREHAAAMAREERIAGLEAALAELGAVVAAMRGVEVAAAPERLP